MCKSSYVTDSDKFKLGESSEDKPNYFTGGEPLKLYAFDWGELWFIFLNVIVLLSIFSEGEASLAFCL